MEADNYNLFLEYWSVSPSDCAWALRAHPLHSFIGFNAGKKSNTMYTPTEITQNCIQNAKKLYPLSAPPIFGEKGEIVMIGFTWAGLHKKAAINLPQDFTRNCITQVTPATKSEHKFIMPLPPSWLLVTCHSIDDPVSGEALKLTSYPELLPF